MIPTCRRLASLRRDNDIRRYRNTVIPKKRNTAIVLFCIFVFSFFGTSVSPYLGIPPFPFGISISRYLSISKAYASESLYFIHTDHLGSTVAITDEDGELVSQNRYFPYGESRNPSSVTRNSVVEGTQLANDGLRVTSYESRITERSYTSQIKDNETSLYYYNARYYDPALGVFVSADPAGDSLNRYGYVHGNPLVYIDPTGNQIFVAGVGIILTIGGYLMAAGAGKALGASVADLFVPHEDEFGPIESITSEGYREGLDLFNVGAGIYTAGALAVPSASWADAKWSNWSVMGSYDPFGVAAAEKYAPGSTAFQPPLNPALESKYYSLVQEIAGKVRSSGVNLNDPDAVARAVSAHTSSAFEYDLLSLKMPMEVCCSRGRGTCGHFADLGTSVMSELGIKSRTVAVLYKPYNSWHGMTGYWTTEVHEVLPGLNTTVDAIHFFEPQVPGELFNGSVDLENHGFFNWGFD